MALGSCVLAEHLLDIPAASVPAARLYALLGIAPTADIPLPTLQTAMSLLLFGLAMWFHFGNRRHRMDVADIAAAASVFAPAAALLSFLFELSHTDFNPGSSFGMSPIAAGGLAVLAIGLQSLHPRRGLASIFAVQQDGGIASPRVLFAAVLVSIVFGYLQVWAISADIIDVALGVALTVTASLLVFIVLIVWNAQLVVRLHREQQRKLAQREKKARLEAATDGLTRLLNRRGWEEGLLAEEARCEREALDACIVAIDLDDLKRTNDQQGHAAGDLLLLRAAHALRNTARQAQPGAARRRDLVARIGGDEFSVLALDIAAGAAPIVAERLRKALADAGVAASLGAAPRSAHGSLAAASEAADQLMYEDKRKRKSERSPAAG